MPLYVGTTNPLQDCSTSHMPANTPAKPQQKHHTALWKLKHGSSWEVLNITPWLSRGSTLDSVQKNKQQKHIKTNIHCFELTRTPVWFQVAAICIPGRRGFSRGRSRRPNSCAKSSSDFSHVRAASRNADVTPSARLEWKSEKCITINGLDCWLGGWVVA